MDTKEITAAVDSTVETVTTRGVCTKKNVRVLPKVLYFRVQSRGFTGTLADAKDRKVGAWALLVSCDDGKGLRLVTDVAYEHGMKIKGEFKDKQDAIIAGLDAKKTWGVSKAAPVKKAKRAELEEKNTELAKQNGELQKQIDDLQARLSGFMAALKPVA